MKCEPPKVSAAFAWLPVDKGSKPFVLEELDPTWVISWHTNLGHWIFLNLSLLSGSNLRRKPISTMYLSWAECDGHEIVIIMLFVWVFDGGKRGSY